MATVRFAPPYSGRFSESAGFIELTLLLSEPLATPVSVVIGRLVSGMIADYDAAEKTVVFAPGQTSAVYRAAIVNDATYEGDETFELAIVRATGPVSVGQSDPNFPFVFTERAYVIIVDDEQLPPGAYTGTSADDVITGSTAGDTLAGYGGDDRLTGGDGDDVMDGGPGADRLEGGLGIDTARGGAGDDLIIAGPGGAQFGRPEYYDGGEGNDTLDYSAAPGAITSYAADIFDTWGVAYPGGFSQVVRSIENLIGSGFNDTLSGSRDDNVIRGGAGDDRISLSVGRDLLDGGEGVDTVTLEPSNGFGVQVDLRTGLVTSGDAIRTTMVGFERYVLSYFDDLLFGTDGADTIEGGRGTDDIRGGAGDDVLGSEGNGILRGEDGADRLSQFRGFADLDGGAGDDILAVDDGGTRIEGGSGSDTIVPSWITYLVDFDILRSTDQLKFIEPYEFNGQALEFVTTLQVHGVENINMSQALQLTFGGDAEANTAAAGPGADRLDGRGGDDILIGRGGADTLTGGAGADLFLYSDATASTATAYDIITDFETSADRILFNVVDPTSVSLIRSGAATFLFVQTAGGAAMTIGVTGDVNGGDIAVNTGTGALLNNIRAYDKGVYLIGDAAANTLIGSNAGDPIQGGAGDDVIIGGGGGDPLFGEAGADTFRYRAASDSNAAGSDGLFGFVSGVDRIDLTGLGVSDLSLIRAGGSTFLFAALASGSFQLAAVAADINLSDVIGAGRGGYMVGSASADVLRGGDLADVIQGGGGSDTLLGGAGADVFRYAAASDAASLEIIQDFQVGVDKLDLSAVRTGAGDRYGYLASGGATFVFVDLGADGVNDMTIALQGVTNLGAADILFG